MLGRFALCLMRDRIAPRYDRAENILLVTVHDQESPEREIMPVGRMKPQEVCHSLVDQKVHTLICGGVTEECRARLELSGITILDNVIGSADGVIAFFLDGGLVSGLEVD
jgi:predicted Fe-Mo cluster-binding NifX family protein